MRSSIESIDLYAGRHVRFFRVAAGMKQKDLARRLNISYQQVQKYEAGRDKISSVRLAEIGEILGFSMSAFWEDFRRSGKIVNNRQALNLMRYFRDISEERTRQALVDIARFIAEKKRK